MRVKVQLEGHLSQYAGSRELSVEIATGSTLRDLAKVLKIPQGEAGSAYLDGKGSLLEAELHEGSVVVLFPPVGGG